MTIDNNLIGKSKLHSYEKFIDKEFTSCPYLYLLNDFILPEFLDKLCLFLQDESLPWEKVGRYDHETVYLGRTKLNWIYDSVIEEAATVIESLTTEVSDVIGRPQKFLSVNIWRDQHPYQIKPHIDRNLIGSAMQIYLNTGLVDTSTHFVWKDQIIKPRNQRGSGYFMDNQGKLIHYLDNPVPKNFVRYSLYAIWQDE